VRGQKAFSRDNNGEQKRERELRRVINENKAGQQAAQKYKVVLGETFNAHPSAVIATAAYTYARACLAQCRTGTPQRHCLALP
jgi:hypothetical protein